jgi:hypothetical protein
VFCVGHGWGKELVLHLGRVLHRIGFDSCISYFEFLCVAFILESWATIVSFLLSNVLGNLVCTSFVDMRHVLKIRNWHIHNRQKNLLENKCVINYYSKIEFFLEYIFFFSKILKNIYWYPQIGVKVHSQTTLVAMCLVIFARKKNSIIKLIQYYPKGHFRQGSKDQKPKDQFEPK